MSPRRPELPLQCPRCFGSLEAEALTWLCVGCTQTYGDAEGFVDFLPDTHEPPQRGLGAAAMERPWFARVYESTWRPFYMSAARGRRADPRAELSWILDQFVSVEGGTCMDLSCGPGVVGRRIVDSGRFDCVVGLDYSAAMLRQSLDHCAAEGMRNFPLLRGDAANLPLRDASIDAVHAGNALHLWPDVPRALAEVRRVLRPGGVFVATTFVRGRGLRRRVGGAFERATRIRFFERGELAQICARVGLCNYAPRIEGNAIWLRAEAPAP